MTEPEIPAAAEAPLSDADTAARDRAARQRFFVIGLFRLSGAIILIFGLVIALERFSWVTGQDARIMGTIIVTVGFFQMVLVPRLMLRAWATPRP